jgi:hypothetical protein
MASNRIFERLERLREQMTAEDLLNEVFHGLSDVEADDILQHIEDMWDIVDDEDEDEDEDEEEESDDDYN